jgi:hydrogenase maturation factor HypE
MLISCDSENVTHVIDKLESARVRATIIGSVLSDSSHRKIIIDGSLQNLTRPTTDALWSALKKVNPS